MSLINACPLQASSMGKAIRSITMIGSIHSQKNFRLHLTVYILPCYLKLLNDVPKYILLNVKIFELFNGFSPF